MTSLAGHNAFAYMARTLIEMNQDNIANTVFARIASDALNYSYPPF